MSRNDAMLMEEMREQQLSNHIDGSSKIEQAYNDACLTAEARLADIKDELRDLILELQGIGYIDRDEAIEIVEADLQEVFVWVYES